MGIGNMFVIVWCYKSANLGLSYLFDKQALTA